MQFLLKVKKLLQVDNNVDYLTLNFMELNSLLDKELNFQIEGIIKHTAKDSKFYKYSNNQWSRWHYF